VTDSASPAAGLGTGVVAHRDAPGPRRILAWVGRWLALAGSAGALSLSYLLPWWSFTLYAPQYPGGLKLVVSLSGVSGDVREVNMLNHYIGMKSLELAAPLERALAGYGIAALVLGVIVAATLLPGRWRRLAVALSALLPAGFIVDSWLWLRHFGHALDPRAPIELPSFTPQMFGNGQIGQFMTFAQPASGFLLALAAPLLVMVALGLDGSRAGES
jgi:hypothetical protein